LLLVDGKVPSLKRRGAVDARLVESHVRFRRVESRDRRAEAVLKIQPAHLAVGYDVKAGGLLQGDGLAHRAVFRGAELVRVHLPLVEKLARAFEIVGPQETAEHIRAN